MVALRFAGLLAIALWLGGLLVLGSIAAPSIFDTVSARQIPDGRALAGAIFGEAFRRFHLLSYACGGIVIATLAIRKVLGPTPRRFPLRAALAVAMLSASLYSGLVVSAEIERTRAAIGVSPSSLAEDDPRRQTFSRLHTTSTGLQVVPIVGALLLMYWELRD